jgi:Nucleotide-diphospho-sugar transferase
VKSRIVVKILKLGYNVLLSDVDVYWFRNPLPFLSSFGPGVLLAQSDEFNEAGIVQCLVYVLFFLTQNLYLWLRVPCLANFKS